MPFVSAPKAEALMGRAFRDTFDKETFYALLKHAPEWQRCEQMVRCTRGVFGAYTFHVRLAKKGPRIQDEVLVRFDMTEPEFAMASEARFGEIGTSMAVKANREVENVYMQIDNDR